MSEPRKLQIFVNLFLFALLKNCYLVEESKEFQWEEPKYINTILLVSWLAIGYVSFELTP